MKWYCSLLCHHPYAVVCAVGALVTSCLILSLTVQQLPAFNDPSLGFEARGTTVSNRAASWHAMLEATRPSGPLTVNPSHRKHRPENPTRKGRPKLRGGGKNRTRHRLPHTHMVCVEAVGGNISIQKNCTSSDLQGKQNLHLDNKDVYENREGESHYHRQHPHRSHPIDVDSQDYVEEEYDEHPGNFANETLVSGEYDTSEFAADNNTTVGGRRGNASSRSVAAIGTGVRGTAPTHRPSVDILRQLGLEHDSEHLDENEDYWVDHHPIHDYEEDEEEDYHSEHHEHSHMAPDGFFCNALVPDYGHVVVSVMGVECSARGADAARGSMDFSSPFSFSSYSSSITEPPNSLLGDNEATSNATVTDEAEAAEDDYAAAVSLLTLPRLRSLCALDARIRQAPSFKVICQTSSPGVCCPSWSIPNYVALLANRTDCHHITEEDVLYLRGLLHTCGLHFDLSLQGGCGGHCSRLPAACMQHDAVYTILHYLADVNFMAQQQLVLPSTPQSGWSSLRTSALFLPVARSSATLPFYEQLTTISLTEGNVTVVSMELGVKNALFDKLLLQDAVLVMAAGAAVLVLVYLYTASLLVTLITLATVASSLLIAYVLYTFVFRIAFFPYMNVLTCIIAVGLGADDTFVFCRVWRSVAREEDGSVKNGGRVSVKVVQEVMNHAASSVVVTSLTTAAAFLASTTSAITAIKCFSIFASSVVIANLLLMLTWVPASLVIAERWRCCCLAWPPAPAAAAAASTTTSSTGALKSIITTTTHHHNPAFTRASNNHTGGGGANPGGGGGGGVMHHSSSNKSPSIIPLDNTHSALNTTHHHSPPTSPPHSPNSPNLNSCNNSPRSPNSPLSSHSTSQSSPRSPHIPASSSVGPSSSNSCLNLAHRGAEFYSKVSKGFFERLLPWLVVKLRVLWVVLLFGIAVYAGILVLYYPRLRLPDSADFQLFNRDHYFERYDLDHKYNFWFERNLRNDVVNRLPIRIVWGFKPIDNGDHLNPASESTLEFDPTFDLSAPESQSWLLHFCMDLRKQDFYMSTMGPLLPNCFIETFKSWMEERKCKDDRQNRYPCCESMRFPYPRWVFDRCIIEAVKVLYQTPRLYFVPGVAGPKFNKTDNKVRALVVEYDSTAIWSLSYDQMHRFFTSVEEWSSAQLKEAPSGLRGGWFTSYLEFYEVQRSLLEGTKLAVLVAVVVSLVVLLITTLNVVVSVVAVVTVAAVMLVTLAALVILGWRLNVLESIVVTAAIGLAVDLTLHYAVAYTKAPQGKRKAAVTWAVTRLGSPVIMTTLTSVAAALAMLPATVLAYLHIATFLMLIALTSFVYSTFFFLPLMSLIGPEERCGQLQLSSADCSEFCACRGDEQVDSRVYQQACVSESTLSTSSVCPPYSSAHNSHEFETQSCYMSGCHNYTHELEPLTSPTLGGGSGGSGSAANSSPLTCLSGSGAAATSTPSGGRRKHNHSSCQHHSKNHQQQQQHCPAHHHNGNSSSGHHHNNPQQQAMGLIVSIQQSRQSRQQQQNGSCAQLVVRKESTESQVSGGGDVGCVCRSASLGSRPTRAGGGRSSTKARNNSTKQQQQSRARARKQVVSKQNSSPHLTPANSVSTLVCSEPDTELEALALAEQLRAQLGGDRTRDQLAQLHQQKVPGNYEQQQRQKQFVKQHNQEQQHFFSTEANTSASMV